MGVLRMPGPLGQWILGGLPDFRPGVASLVLSQTPGGAEGDAAPAPVATSSEPETEEDKNAAAALDVKAGQTITLKFWGKGDARGGEPSIEYTTTVFDTPEKAALHALKPLIAKFKNEEYGGLIYKIAGKNLYLAGPAVTDGDQAMVSLASMGFGKGTWARGDLPGLKTISTYHTHVRGDVDLGGGTVSKHYEGIVAPSQIGFVKKLRVSLQAKGANRDKIFDDALKDPTLLGGDVGVAVNSHVDMYVLTRKDGFYHLDWRTLKETRLKVEAANASLRMPPAR